MHGSGNQEVELIVASLTIIPNNPFAEFYSHLTILNFMPMKFRDARPKEGNNSIKEYTNGLLNWKVRLPHGHFGLHMQLNQKEEEGVTLLASAVDPNYQEEIGLLVYNGEKEDYTWNPGNSLGCLLILYVNSQ